MNSYEKIRAKFFGLILDIHFASGYIIEESGILCHASGTITVNAFTF
jgi:hypothetical protein